MGYAAEQPKKTTFSIKIRLILSAIVLLMLALGFNAMLSLNSLEKLYVESMASQYSAIGKDLQRNLEKSLKFGKSLEKFIGIENILADAKQHILRSMSEEFGAESFFTSISGDISVSIALPDGKILYSTNQALVNSVLPEEARPNYTAIGSNAGAYFEYQAAYIVPLPIRDGKNTWVGSGIIKFSESQIKSLLTSVQQKSIRRIAEILAASVLLLLLLFKLFTTYALEHGTFPKRKISLIMLFVIGTAQLVFSAENTNDFRIYYLDINRAKIRTMTTLLKEDIEFYFTKGIKINKLMKMEASLGEIIASLPELDQIVILDQQDMPLYMANKERAANMQTLSEPEAEQLRQKLSLEIDPEYSVRLDLMNQNNAEGFISANSSKEGYISTNLSREVIMAKLFDIALDSATILVISMLFLGEVLILIILFIERQLFQSVTSYSIHYSDIRPAGFLFFFGVDMTITFLPLYMEKLYAPIFGLSKDIVMGLPISVRVFFTAIAIVIAGVWLDRRRWHEPLIIGLLLVSGGILYSWAAPDALHFIISRAVVGLGYGLALMAFQGFVIDYTNEENKAQGLTQFFAGVYAGSICGAAVGAMLADKIGFKPVFIIGAVVVWVVLLYIFIFIRETFKTPIQRAVKGQKSVLDIRQLFIFLFNRNILALILLMSIPAAIAEVGLVDYFSPVYLNRIGASQSNIGRIFMLHGLCLIYLAPFIGKYIDAASNKRKYIVFGGILGSFAFMVFYFSEGMLAAAIAIFMLGLSASFESSRSAYVLRLQVSQELGSGQVISTLSSAYRVGQVLGPLIFSTFVLTADIKQALIYLGGIYGLMSLLFLLFSRNDE